MFSSRTGGGEAGKGISSRVGVLPKTGIDAESWSESDWGAAGRG